MTKNGRAIGAERRGSLYVPQMDWMGEGDMERVLEIEALSFPVPWRREGFIRILQRKGAIAMVVLLTGDVAGYVVYEYLPSILTIHNLAIAPHIRRRGLGRLIVDCLRRKLSRRRRAIETFTAESNLDAQLFFRALGFQCIGIVLEKYDDGQNAYRFVWRAQAESKPQRTRRTQRKNNG